MVSKFQNKIQSFIRTGLQVLACFFLYSFFWVFAAPICFPFIKKTKIYFRYFFYTVFLGLMFYWSGFLNVWAFLIPLLSLELAILIRRNKKLSFNSTYLLLSLLTLVVLHLGLYVLFDGYAPEALDQQTLAWMQKINQSWKTFGSQIGRGSRFSEYSDMNWYDYLDYVPVFYYCSFIIGFFACLWRDWILTKFKCPAPLFWVMVLSFAAGFLSWDWISGTLSLQETHLEIVKSYQSFFVKIVVVLSCIYFFQGLSVSSYLMEKFKITRFWQNLWYILVILNLPMVLVFLGLLDFLFEFRSVSGPSDKSDES